jgi:hypothetical protein
MSDHHAANEAAADLASVGAADFRGAMNTGFRLSHAAGDVELRLVDVVEGRAGHRAAGAFSLLFVGAPGPCLPQAIYPLANERLGRLELFLVPIGPAEGGNGYQAVFG